VPTKIESKCAELCHDGEVMIENSPRRLFGRGDIFASFPSCAVRTDDAIVEAGKQGEGY
jgi:hypothetical protein